MAVLGVEVQSSSAKQVSKRVKVAQFGEGYDQVQVDGINPLIESWNVTFIAMTKTNAIAFENNLKNWLWTEVIDWQAPNETLTSKWKIIDYSVRCEDGIIFEISATLKRFYGV